MGDTLASGASIAGPAGTARSSVRAGDRLPGELCTLVLPMNVPWVSRLGADSGGQEFWPARRSK